MKTIKVNENITIVTTIENDDVKQAILQWASQEKPNNPIYEKVKELAEEGDQHIRNCAHQVEIPEALSFSGMLKQWLLDNDRFISIKQRDWLSKKCELIDRYKRKVPVLETRKALSEMEELPY